MSDERDLEIRVRLQFERIAELVKQVDERDEKLAALRDAVQAARALDKWFDRGVNCHPPYDLCENLHSALVKIDTLEEK